MDLTSCCFLVAVAASAPTFSAYLFAIAFYFSSTISSLAFSFAATINFGCISLIYYCNFPTTSFVSASVSNPTLYFLILNGRLSI